MLLVVEKFSAELNNPRGISQISLDPLLLGGVWARDYSDPHAMGDGCVKSLAMNGHTHPYAQQPCVG